MYAQINYEQTLGTGPHAVTIHRAGCFLTAFCNLLERFGKQVDPPALDTYFIEHNAFIREADGTDDLLSWGSVTAYDPYVRLVSSAAGAPTEDNSIVKFVYNGGTTHFCLVLSAKDHTIIDSWDGKVKNWSVYGGPVWHGTYTNTAPQPATTAKPAPAPSLGVYDVVVAVPGYMTSNNAANHLAQVNTVEPGHYEVFTEAHGMKNVTKLAGVAGTWINPADNHKPEPAPVPVVPAPAPKPANIVFTKLAEPLELVTDRDTHKWRLDFPNDTKAVSVQDLPKGTPFTAYGKGQRTDHDKPCYFMTKEDFGQADVTGIPANNYGVNTVDLVAAPQPPAPAAPVKAVPAPAPTPVPAPAPATEAANGEGDSVTVNVVKRSWQDSFTAFLGVRPYVAKASTKVHDLADTSKAEQQLVKDGVYNIAGTFTGPDGLKYYRTATSVKNASWYGIPELCLEPKEQADQDNFVDHMLEEADNIRREIGHFTSHEKRLITAANIDGALGRLFHGKKTKQGAK